MFLWRNNKNYPKIPSLSVPLIWFYSLGAIDEIVQNFEDISKKKNKKKINKNNFWYSSFQGVKEIEEMWNNMKFTVVPYMKGPSMRGYILGAIDEIVQNLDDSSMNLQSMSASRFVGPFLNSVQNWEKSLSHISEVLDVSRRIVSDLSL